jgi:STE24 endopeptidase
MELLSRVTHFEVAVAFMAAIYLFELWLDLRQRSRYYRGKLPKVLSAAVKPEEFAKSQQYGLARSTFGLASDLFQMAHDVLMIANLAKVWDLAVSARAALHLPESELYTSLVFASMMYVESTLVGIPFSLYSNFVLEEKFGFNQMTLKTYVLDMLKGTALFVVLGLPVMSLLLETIRWGGDNMWIYVSVLAMVLSLVMVAVYPSLIAPLFNKFTPLEPGPIREAVYELAKKLQFPLSHLYVIDASTRSDHSNAYFYGFFKTKHIVLYDTLLKQVDTKGLVAILAHELGHWKYGHVFKGFLISQVQMTLYFYVVGKGLHSPDMFASFGFHEQRPILIGLALFSLMTAPVSNIVGFLMNMVTRKFEYEADKFATELGHDLAPALISIEAKNLSALDPDPVYSSYHYSHPTLLERLDAMKRYQKRGNVKWQ